jgi:hypothetical protein
LLLAVAGALSSCIGVPIPIPPPMAQVQAITDCAPADACPAGGVIVDIEGFANPGALVVVQNITRSHPNAVAYTASAFATRTGASADGGADASAPDAGAPSASGRYFVRLGPARAGAAEPVTVSQRGDQLSVRQFFEVEGGRYEASNERFIFVR